MSAWWHRPGREPCHQEPDGGGVRGLRLGVPRSGQVAFASSDITVGYYALFMPEAGSKGRAVSDGLLGVGP